MPKSRLCLFAVFEVKFLGPTCLFFWLILDAAPSINPPSVGLDESEAEPGSPAGSSQEF